MSAVLVSILTLALFARVMKQAFFGEPGECCEEVKEVPGWMRASMAGLALVALFGGLLMLPEAREAFLDPAAAVFSLSANHGAAVVHSPATG